MERTTSTIVTFRFAFRLEGLPGSYPAGSYIIETIEELVLGVSVVAYRRVGTFITLPMLRGLSSGRQIVPITPECLEAAIDRDNRAYDAQPAPVSHSLRAPSRSSQDSPFNRRQLADCRTPEVFSSPSRSTWSFRTKSIMPLLYIALTYIAFGFLALVIMGAPF